MWTHRDLVDGAFSFQDLMDAHEALDVRAANEASLREWHAARRG